MVTGALGANGLVLIKLFLCFQSMVLGALGANGLVLIKLVLCFQSMVTGALGANGLVLIKLFLCFQSMVTGAPGANGLALEHAVCHAVMVLRNELEQELVITHPLLATGPHVLDQTRTARVKPATILPAHVRIDIIKPLKRHL